MLFFISILVLFFRKQGCFEASKLGKIGLIKGFGLVFAINFAELHHKNPDFGTFFTRILEALQFKSIVFTVKKQANNR